ncbi:sporulation protein YjcZ [Paenibacillus swuensis]|nr:sporulation protein YjcZ [Paenibacillus swuensis]
MGGTGVGGYSSAGVVLVLFILLVIISRTFLY